MGGGRWIEQWEPEDETFWRETGRRSHGGTCSSR